MKALIVVDMQNDFVDPNGSIYCGLQAREIIIPICKRIDIYLENKDRVFFLQDTHQTGDKSLNLFGNHCIEDTWGHEIIPELNNYLEHEYTYTIRKNRFSGFYNTGLYGTFLDLGIVDVELVGVFTSMCVFETAIDSADRDYDISIPRDCVADSDSTTHEFFLKRMAEIYNVAVI